MQQKEITKTLKNFTNFLTINYEAGLGRSGAKKELVRKKENTAPLYELSPLKTLPQENNAKPEV